MFQSKVYVNKEIETDPILKAKKLKISVEIIADYQNLTMLKPISYCLLTISANYRFVYSHLICCHLWGLWHIIIFSNLILTNFPCFPTYATYVAERPLKNNQNELDISGLAQPVDPENLKKLLGPLKVQTSSISSLLKKLS